MRFAAAEMAVGDVDLAEAAPEQRLGATNAQIEVSPWDPDTPYLEDLKAAGSDAYK